MSAVMHTPEENSMSKLTDRTRAEHTLMLYSKLYGVESYCKEQGFSLLCLLSPAREYRVYFHKT